MEVSLNIIIQIFIYLIIPKCFAAETIGSRDSNENQPGNSFVVHLKVHDLKIEEIDCFNMEIKVHATIIQSWANQIHSMNSTVSLMELEKNQSPELIIFDGKNIKIDFAGEIELKNHTFIKEQRIEFSSHCNMDFSYYPFDYETCILDIRTRNTFKESHTHSTGIISHSKHHEIGFKHHSHLSPFYVTSIQTIYRNISNHNDSVFQAKVVLKFRRLWRSYFGTYFLPLNIFVCLSLLSLWLVYPKISVVLNFLNIWFISIYLILFRNNMDIPKVYYVIATDVFSTTCIIIIVLVLLVNIYVLYYVKCDEEDGDDRAGRSRRKTYDLNRGNTTREVVPAIISRGIGRPATPPDTPPPGGSQVQDTNWKIIKSKLLDKVRRNSHWTLLFTFIIFNIIFWITMLTLHYSN